MDSKSIADLASTPLTSDKKSSLASKSISRVDLLKTGAAMAAGIGLGLSVKSAIAAPTIQVTDHDYNDAAAPSEVLLHDDFKEGLDLAHTWALLRFGSFAANDGVVTTSPSGLHVQPSGANSETGEPAFTLAGAGALNHINWMAVTRHVSSNAYPGFDAAPGYVLSCTMWGSGQTFGTAAHPFGSAVTDPQSDLRLAAFASTFFDYETGMVFDTWETNTRIYPYYQREDLSGTATYQRFSSIFPGVPRSRDGENQLSI